MLKKILITNLFLLSLSFTSSIAQELNCEYFEGEWKGNKKGTGYSAKATGALSVAQGGLGINSGSGAYRAVRSNGSALTTDQHGIASMNVYTGNSTWSRPSGVRYIRVQVQGAGGLLSFPVLSFDLLWDLTLI